MSISDSIRNQLQGAVGKREHIEADVEKHEAGDFNQRVALYARLDQWRRELEQCMRFVKEEQDKLSPVLLEDMALNGIQNINVEGLSIHQRRDFYCNKLSNAEGVTQEAICEALRELGMEYMVTEGYSAASLKAKVREWLDEGVEIPEPLSSMIRYGEAVRLVATK